MGNARGPRTITAAGTVALRSNGDGGTEVLLVHRPRYQDWSLPKGKLNSIEYLPSCAVRETREESATTVALGIPLDPIRYPVGSGTKTVYYWRARVVGNGRHKANAEVDQAVWLSVREALDLLTYADERPPLRQAVALSESTPLLIVRHGKALPRAAWDGIDTERPLDDRGRRQSRLIGTLLDAYGVGRLASSTSTRCVDTFGPHATAATMDLETVAALSEEAAEADPQAVTAWMRAAAAQAAGSGVPVAICGHRPVFPQMLAALDMPERSLPPGAALVAHLAPDASVLAVEVHHSPV